MVEYLSHTRHFGIVDTDNYGSDYPNERFVVSCWLRKATAEAIAKLLNDEMEGNSRYYKVVDRGYQLKLGSEP